MIKDTIYNTPYGRALLYNTKDNLYNQNSSQNNEEKNEESALALPRVHCLKLQDIVLADGKHPTLYTCAKTLPHPKPRGDDDVILGNFGRGTVLKVESCSEGSSGDDEKVVVQLTNWRLARRSTVKIYCNASNFTNSEQYRIVRKKRVYEMSIYERIEHSKVLKKEAIPHFVKGDYEKALDLFTQAVYAVRMQQHTPESTNEMRADLVEIMISCSNNAASCFVKMGKWEEAQQHARNALLLIDALDGKRGQKVHLILREGGLSDLKIFGEWRVKSYLIIARAEAEQQEFSMALARLKQAMSVTRGGIGINAKVKLGLEKQDNEIRRLMQTYGERHKMLYRKEKARAKAMFSGNEKSKSINGTKPDQNGSNVSKVEQKASLKGKTINNDKKKVVPSEKKSEKDVTQVENVNKSNVKDTTKSLPDTTKSLPDNNDENLDSNEGYDGNSEDDYIPWYEEHKEALILTGVGALALGTIVTMRSIRSKS